MVTISCADNDNWLQCMRSWRLIWRHAIFDPSKFGKESQGWFRLLPLWMMMSRSQVFAAPWRGDGDEDMKSQVWLNLFPLEMMMSRCQVFAAPWKQEKGWLLYLRSLPQGMTNNSGRPLFPKLSRYKQIVIVKLLNFGQFASFIWEQKSRHRQQNPSNSEEEFWTFCVTAAIPLKSWLRKHKRMKHGHFFLTEDWHRSVNAGCVWHGMCISVLSDRPAL